MTATVQMPGNVTGADAPVVSDRPENVPEKFWNAETKTVNTEALLASYSELERRQSQAPKPAAQVPAEAAAPAASEPPEALPNPEEEQAREAATAAGVDFDALNSKFQTNGALEEADYEALEKGGIPRALVDSYIAGQQALVDAQRAELLAPVGGDAGYAQMVEWAGANLPAAEVAAYDAIVDGDNPAATKLAIEGLYAKYKAASTSEPKLITGNAASGADVYASLEQMKADMRNPLYKKDPAFRARVEAKLARSGV